MILAKPQADEVTPDLIRVAEIKSEILARPGSRWEAYDQGRFDFAAGLPLCRNPFRMPEGVGYHTCEGDWVRGWNAEAQRRAVRAAAPDLLAALQRARGLIAQSSAVVRQGDTGALTILEEIDAAIALAGGSTNGR